jgi:hypothetical protein
LEILSEKMKSRGQFYNNSRSHVTLPNILQKFVTALERLEKDGCGVIKKLRASVNARRKTVVFVELEELPGEIALVSRDEYRKKFQLPIHKAISEPTKIQLQEKQLLPSS